MTLVANQPDITDILLLFPAIPDGPVVYGDFSSSTTLQNRYVAVDYATTFAMIGLVDSWSIATGSTVEVSTRSNWN